jgi:AcrR family transcriptional regulator
MSTAPRKPSAKALATRQRLVEAAIRLFAERGYDEVSVRDVGEALGMTTGAIYRRFRNKAELLAAAVAAKVALEVDRPPGAPIPISYVQGATELLASHPDRAALRALLLDATAAAKSDAFVRRSLADLQRERFAAWARVARRDQDRGTLSPDIGAETLVKLLWALEFGLVIFDVFGLEPPAAEEASAAVSRLLKPLEA